MNYWENNILIFMYLKIIKGILKIKNIYLNRFIRWQIRYSRRKNQESWKLDLRKLFKILFINRNSQNYERGIRKMKARREILLNI